MSEKTFKTYEEQIKILKSRNLKIGQDAIKVLKFENYYEVINGYKDLFIKIKSPETFIDGSSFDGLYNLYIFDRNIRIIYLKYIIKAEHYFKSVLSYEFSKLYGYKDYLKCNNFDCSSKMKLKSINILINKVQNEVAINLNKHHEAITHYTESYGYIPLWVLTSILTLGEVSHFYYDLKPHDKNLIARQFNINPDEFSKHIYNLSLARNICAHDDKFYDVRFEKGINHKFIHNFNLLGLAKEDVYRGTKDIFSIAIILSIILPREDINDFVNRMSSEIDLLKNNLNSINISKVLNKMGYPNSWKNIVNLSHCSTL